MASRLGLIVAGILVVVLAIALAIGLMAPSVSGATSATLKTGFMEMKGGDISPADIIGSMPAGSGNAGDDYARAAEMTKRNEQQIARRSAGGLRTAGNIASHVAAGAAKAQMEYTLVHTPGSFEVEYVYAPARDLQRVSGALCILAETHRKKKNFREAEKVLHDMLVMGWHMMQERARVDMVQCGLGVQGRALGELQLLYSTWGGQHGGKQPALAAYRSQLRKVRRDYEDKHKICWRTKPNPGDVCYILEHDKDRAWRVQALLTLAIVKFTTQRTGDRKRAESLLQRFAGSSDRYEAAAARSGRDFTSDQLHGLGSKF